jgi:hypothetical protein
MCLDPTGEYEVTIEPVYLDPEADDLVVKEVFVTHPDDGKLAFPNNEELADLWDKYIAEVCYFLFLTSNLDVISLVSHYKHIPITKVLKFFRYDCLQLAYYMIMSIY